MVNSGQQTVSVEQILANEEFAKRPSRAPDHQLENEALRDLARKLGQSPRVAMQGLVEQALRICGAESAGISIAELEGDREIFRWHAVAGQLAPFLNGTMPRDFSPCGEVVRRRETLLMRHMIRHYGYVEQLNMPLPEVMLVPFFHQDQPIGTIWVVSHSGQRGFDSEDRRLLESLATFTTGIVQAYLAARREEKISEEARLGERQLSLIINSLPALVAYIDPELRYRFANERYRLTLGIDPSTMMGRHWSEVVGQETFERLRPLLDRAFAGETFQFEQELALAAGKTSTMRISYTPDVDASTGQVRGVIALGQDVSEQAKVRRQLEESTRELAQSVASLREERDLRERFVAALTHDLRNPLSAARLTAQLISVKAGQDARLLAQSGRIMSAIDRADRMIQDLLDANRIKAGEGIPINPERCDLGEVVAKVVQDLSELHGQRFRFDPPAQPLVGSWDGEAIVRVVENLAGNALKYGEEDAPITIGLTRAADSVLLAVSNRGEVIPASEHARLFEPYRRMGSAVSSRKKGWGIGLTLVRGIAQAHGGRVSVRSDEASGTTFELDLPMLEA